MSPQDEFFTPEEVDRQIDQVSQLKQGERADAEVIASLRSFYGIDTQQEQGMLDRVWSRIENTAPPLQHNLQQEREGGIDTQKRQIPLSNMALHRRSTTLHAATGYAGGCRFRGGTGRQYGDTFLLHSP